MVSDITAVLGIYITSPEHLKMTEDFMEDMKIRFPDVPVSLSCVGCSQEIQDILVAKYGDRIVTGTTERVSFSETWNNAILGVKTPKFVFLHNDMYLEDNFFRNFSKALDTLGTDYFGLYVTVEPLVNMGFPRPGKIVAPFGSDLQDFKKDEFLKFCKKYITEKGEQYTRGYGFYMGGFTENINKVGGFDYTTFFPIFCEDDDLSLRIRIAGYKVAVIPEALVYHFGSKTTRTMTGAKMTNGEIESNRKFVQKWGIEARYLWVTGYEDNDDVIDIGTETIGFYSEVPISKLDESNVEPLVNLIFTTKKHEIPDIEIHQVGPTNFNQLAYLVGDLRWNHKHLKPGKVAQVGSYKIQVNRVREEKREDRSNYLSMLKSK